MIIKVVEVNLLDSSETILCQQCNCVTMIPHGLSEQISKKYPWADVYSRRKMKTRNCTSEPSIPGTIQVTTEASPEALPEALPEAITSSTKKVIHMFGQVLPGKPNTFTKYYQHVKIEDGPEDRINYFKMCINELDSLKLDSPVAMPYKIGCGLAGGNWEIYKKILEKCETNVVLYKYDEALGSGMNK